MDSRLTRLVKAIDTFVAQHKKQQMRAFVVLLDTNNAENRAKLAAFASKHGIAIPLTMAINGAKGPPAYRLNPQVATTVLVARRNVVRAIFALAGPPPEDGEAQAKEVDDILAAARDTLK